MKKAICQIHIVASVEVLNPQLRNKSQEKKAGFLFLDLSKGYGRQKRWMFHSNKPFIYRIAMKKI